MRLVLCPLQRVDRDDAPLERGERVTPGRNFAPDPLNAQRVEPHQRDREPRPQFVLELLQNRLRRDHQDALTPPTPDEFSQQKTNFESLTQTHNISDQNPWLGFGQSQLGRPLLVGLAVHQVTPGRRQPTFRTRQWRAPQHRLDIEPGTAKSRCVIGDQDSVFRTQRFDGVEPDPVEEHGCLVPDQLVDTQGLDHRAVRSDRLGVAYQPFHAADLDPGSGGVRRSLFQRRFGGRAGGSGHRVVPPEGFGPAVRGWAPARREPERA